jgi:CubicO group peptidase (beta-lactamase class C family)
MRNIVRTAALLSLMHIFPAVGQPEAVKAAMAANTVPSISYAQIRNGKIVQVAAFGEQSPGTPATTDTLYNTASLAKPLTAEVILRLVSKGAFSLDESMAPTFVDPDIAGDPRNTLLTARIALSHQTGFPNWRDKTGLKFQFDPGTAYGYSGEGYQYVARFVEKKTGHSFEDLAQTYLFGPEGMTRTSYVGEPWFSGHVALPTTAKGETLKPTIAQHFIAADLVYTTAADYARFMLSVLRDSDLSSAVAADRLRIQRSVRQKDCMGRAASVCPEDIGPGLGWQVIILPGHTVMTHSGKDTGLFTFAYLDKTTGEGAVLLTNGDAGDKVVLPLLRQLNASQAFIDYLAARSN